MNIHGMIFRLVAYIFFGIVMEVLVSSITTASRCGWRDDAKKMIGSVSIFMAPVYGLGLLFLFEPIRELLLPFNSWIQFLAYGCAFTLIEFLAGAFFDRVCHIRLWDYTDCSDSIMGYTRTALFFQWGFAGIMLSSYAGLLLYLSPFIVKFF